MLLVEQLGEVIPGERDAEAPREVAAENEHDNNGQRS